MYSPDSIKILILWTVTPRLVEAFHAAFYSFHPPLGGHHLVGSFILSTASGWFHRSGWSRTGMVPALLALSHLVRYPGYITTLLGKPDAYHAASNPVRKDSRCPSGRGLIRHGMHQACPGVVNSLGTSPSAKVQEEQGPYLCETIQSGGTIQKRWTG